jgi:hypothetical protein
LPAEIGIAGKWIPKAEICVEGGWYALFHIVRLCAKILELPAHLVRLRIGNKKSGAPVNFWAAPTAPAAPGSTGRAGNYEGDTVMRSDLVFGALSHVSNRYQLCQLASKATRKLHKPNTRLQDTTNEVLCRFQTTNPGTLAPKQEAEAPQIERRRAA